MERPKTQQEIALEQNQELIVKGRAFEAMMACGAWRQLKAVFAELRDKSKQELLEHPYAAANVQIRYLDRWREFEFITGEIENHVEVVVEHYREFLQETMSEAQRAALEITPEVFHGQQPT